MGDSKKHTKYSTEHTEYSKEHTEHSKEHTEHSKEHTEHSKEYSKEHSKEYSKEHSKKHTEHSKEHTEHGKEHTGHSKEHTGHSKEHTGHGKEHTGHSKEQLYAEISDLKKQVANIKKRNLRYAEKITVLQKSEQYFREECEKTKCRQKLATKILALLNQPFEHSNIINEILCNIKRFTDFQSIGIRLKKGNDYPYYCTEGFSDDFLKSEQYICKQKGSPQCLCGKVLLGEIGSDIPHFSDNGSLWIDDVASLYPQIHYTKINGLRTRCNKEGYRSMALVPIRFDGEIIGILQCNDRRKNQFNHDWIIFFENIVNSIGIVLKNELGIRKHNLLEEELRQSQKLEILGQLANGVAHDFNNNLACITGYADMLLQEVMDKRFQEYAKMIIQSVERSAGLTKQLLEFSHKDTANDIPINIHILIDEVASMLKRSIDKKITIQCIIKAKDTTIIGNPSQLQSVLLNLGLNARDAMPEGGRIIFATENIDLENKSLQKSLHGSSLQKYLQISVSDTGIGMDENIRSKIFEPFFTTKEKGNGIGLASVHSIIKKYHGTIEVLSKPANGSIFKINLPICKKLKSGLDLNHHQVIHSPLIKAKILLIDDEKFFNEMLSKILESLAYKVVIAEGVQKSIDFYQKYWHNIDLIILDLIMPKMNGDETLLALRKINPKAKILICSGNKAGQKIYQSTIKKAHGFISKPFRISELSKIIKTILTSNDAK